MAKNGGQIKNYIMSCTYKERRARELANYRQRVCELRLMDPDEVDFEYIALKSEYEHKKSNLTIFMILIAVAVLMNVWEYFFLFIEKAMQYSLSYEGSELEIVKVSFACAAIIAVFITLIISYVLSMYLKKTYQMHKDIMIIEEVKINNSKRVRTPVT